MSGPTCARGADQLGSLFQIVAPEGIGDDLDRVQAQLEAPVDGAPHFVRRLAQGIDSAIGQHAGALPSAQEFGQRLAAGLAADIP